MNIIFLDVDGVLNNEGTFRKKYAMPEIDEEMVVRLKSIVDATEAKIVLSSSWRTGYHEDAEKSSENCKELVETLKKHGMEIYDKTPVLEGWNRQQEIKEWMKGKDIDAFVILDDETEFLMDFASSNLVKTSALPDGVTLRSMSEATGLQDEHTRKAIQILKS